MGGEAGGRSAPDSGERTKARSQKRVRRAKGPPGRLWLRAQEQGAEGDQRGGGGGGADPGEPEMPSKLLLRNEGLPGDSR